MIASGEIIGGLLLLIFIIYYGVNNNDYSTATKADDARRLVNKILKQNNCKTECVRVYGFPEETLAMAPEYKLVAELSNGGKIPIKLSIVRKNGKCMQQVEILGK